MGPTKLLLRRSFIFLLVTFLSACAVQLAPSYDKAVHEGIINANSKIMALFATVSLGTEANTFSQREAAYNETIGLVDALSIQAKARPVPDNKAIEKARMFLASRDADKAPTNDPATEQIKEIPSAAALEQISKQLLKMKSVDHSKGLTPKLVEIFKGAVVISMDQALTYESFLQR